MKITIFPKTFYPSLSIDSPLRHDCVTQRGKLSSKKPTNLYFLLAKRYRWINRWLKNKTNIIELGCGAGFGSFFYEKNVVLTDIEKHPWVDEKIDAGALPYEDDSVDAFICCASIHHFVQPKIFLENARTRLRKGGYLIIQEPENSTFMKLFLLITKVEGWSDEVDVFDEGQICNDPKNPWSGNNSIGHQLFNDEKKFHENIAGYKIIENELQECFVWILSGGIYSQQKALGSSRHLYVIAERLDRLLIKLAPGVFTLMRYVVLEKV